MSAAPSSAAVFHSRGEIPGLAFPEADRVVTRNFFLRTEDRSRIEKLAHAKLDSDLLTVYIGKRDGATIGYAFVDTHIVRTLPETLLIVLSPAGEVTATYVLAFHEPSEYAPSPRWLGRLDGSVSTDHLRVGNEVTGITGATLSSHAVTAALRRALAVYAVLLGGER